MPNHSTSRLGPQDLANLLAIGLEDNGVRSKAPTDPEIERLLQEMLTRNIAVASTSVDGGVSGEGTFRDQILNPQVKMEALRAIKQYAKTLVSRTTDDAEKAAATAIYYASIAAALAFRGKKTTQYSYHALGEGIAKLRGKGWLLPELQDLFDKASKICRDRGRESV